MHCARHEKPFPCPDCAEASRRRRARELADRLHDLAKVCSDDGDTRFLRVLADRIERRPVDPAYSDLARQVFE